MNTFTYSYPVKVYFGQKAAEQNLAQELTRISGNWSIVTINSQLNSSPWGLW